MHDASRPHREGSPHASHSSHESERRGGQDIHLPPSRRHAGRVGRRVLLLDNDPQASLSQGFWGPIATADLDPAATIAALYAGPAPFPEQVIRPAGVPGIDLVPGSKHATRYNVPEPHATPFEAQHGLRSFLEEVRDCYDLVLIDNAPNLHLCSWAALVASNYLIVPLQAEDYGARVCGPVQESVDLVRTGPNPASGCWGSC